MPSLPHRLLLVALTAAAECVAQGTEDLRDEELLQRAAFEAQAFSKSDDALAADRDALSAGAEPLRAALAAASAELPPTPPDPLALRDIGPADLDSIFARHEEYAEAAARKALALEESLRLAEARSRLLLSALDRIRGAEAAAASAGPVLLELKRRVDAGRIAADRVALDEKRRPLEEYLSRIDATRRAASALRAGFEEESKRIEQQRKDLALAAQTPSAGAAATARARIASGLLLEARRLGMSEYEELAKADPATLPGTIARLAEEWRRVVESRGPSRAAAEAAAAELEALDREAATVAVPDRAAIPEGEGHAELRAARREAGFASAMAAYHERRIAALGKAREAAARLEAALRAAADTESAAARQTVKLWAASIRAAEAKAAGALEAFEPPPGAALADLEAVLRATADARARDRTAADALAARLRSAAGEEAARGDLVAAEQDRARAEATLREEETYAIHLAEMAGLTPDDLAGLLRPDGAIAKSLAAAAAAADEAARARDAAEARVRNRRDAIAAIESPYTERVLREGQARAAEIRKEIESLAEGMLPADREAAPLGLPSEEREEPADAGRDEAESAAAMKRAIEEEQAFAKELVRYFADLAQGTADWKAAVAASEEAAGRAAQALTALVNEEKRKYACARELERRYNAGAIPRDRLPEDLANAGTRDAIRAAVTRRDSLVKEQETTRARRQEEARRLDAISGTAAWARIRSAAADRKAAIIGRPLRHLEAARAGFDDLAEADRKALLFEAQNLRSADEGFLDGMVASWSPVKDRERFEEPLRAWYGELALQRRASTEFAAAIAAYDELVSVSGAFREEMAGAPEPLRASVERRADDYRAARHLAAIAASPGSRTQIETAYRAAWKHDLPYPADTRGWSKPWWAEQLFIAEARLRGQRDWLRETERLLSKLGIEAEMGRYRRQLARISAAVDLGEAHRARVRGDIDRLRVAYRQEALRGWLAALARILVAPALAWGLLRLMRRIFRRIEKRMEASAAPDIEDRRRRVSTITRVSGAAIAVAIWAVVGIYVLGTVGVNVTPLLASAGVVGLAVAFGAQALIRDFLSGFFILLENQYTIGDVVDVGGVAGVVESISLRVTVLRDLEGAVHYIPNGTLSRVSNKTQGWSRAVIDVSVGYREDIDQATGVIQDVLAKLRLELPWKFWIIEEPVVAGVESLADSAVSLRVMVKTRPGRQWDMARELRKRIKNAFDAAGIEIPFPQRVVHHVREAPDRGGPPEGAAPKEAPPEA